MDGIKGETLPLKATDTAARPHVLLADKDAFVLPGQQPSTGKTTHASADNYNIVSVFEFHHVTLSAGII
jgi:hypothetical protein